MNGAGFLKLERALHARADETGLEFLWIWELKQPTVVVGRSGNVEAEVNTGLCRSDGVPVLRRDSGGGAVLLGRGCMSYTLILNLDRRPELRDVRSSFRLILECVAEATGVEGVERQENDLAIMRKKFGGSSQRRLKRTVLHHGTILYAFDLATVGRYLREPIRRPEYRQQRTHAEFLQNAPLSRDFASRLRSMFPEARPAS